MGKEKDLSFAEPPHIGNRSDALELLDALIAAETAEGTNFALEALKDAIERSII